MNDVFEIAGMHIKYCDIQDYRVVQCEYIYRPVYHEALRNGILARFRSVYEFVGMRPYAAIMDENIRKTAVGAYQPVDLLGAMAKDAWEGAASLIGNAFNIRGPQKVKYLCVNQTGRKFETFLDDVPALLMRNDGKVSDVYKNDELYPLLGEPIAPAIGIISALSIKAKESFIFFGEGIQLDDPTQEYNRLGSELSAYEERRKALNAPPMNAPLLQGIIKLFQPNPTKLPESARLLSVDDEDKPYRLSDGKDHGSI